MPEDAEQIQIFKADSNAQPIINLAVEGDFDPVTLREIAQNELATRLERAPGVAAVTVNGGLRRQIHIELSKEKITALNLSVDRVVQMLRQENQNTPLGEVSARATRPTSSAARASSPTSTTSATSWS